MKKMIAIVAAMAMLVVPTLAAGGGTATILVPKSCEEVKSATYSSGGGKNLVVYAKILCKEGSKDTLYLAEKGSLSGAFGFGRFTLPDRIVIKKADVPVAEWE